MKKAFITAMPTIAERLKELESVDDAGLMMGYRFLVTPRRKRAGTKAASKKPARKHKASAALRKPAIKPAHKVH